MRKFNSGFERDAQRQKMPPRVAPRLSAQMKNMRLRNKKTLRSSKK